MVPQRRGEPVLDEEFERERRATIAQLAADDTLRDSALAFMVAANRHRYSYHFDWLGLPIIQYPPDIVAIQELIWRIRPELVIETGVARGGSLALSASILELIGGGGRALGIDIEIRPHNRTALQNHALAHRIELIEGSSIDPDVVRAVHSRARGRDPVLVLLDSMHTHDHVLSELESYSPLVTPGSYIVVFDTIIERLPADSFPDRPWGVGDNPMTAVRAFLARGDRFEIDRQLESKLLVTVAPEGYLRRRR